MSTGVTTRATTARMARSTRSQTAQKNNRAEAGPVDNVFNRSVSLAAGPSRRKSTSRNAVSEELTTRSGRRLIKPSKAKDQAAPQVTRARSPSHDSHREVSMLLQVEEGSSKPRTTRHINSKVTVTPIKALQIQSTESSLTQVDPEPHPATQDQRSLKRKRSQHNALEDANKRIKELEEALEKSEEVRKSRDAVISEMDTKLLQMSQDKGPNRFERAQVLLNQIENHFTCVLCSEVMAYPVIISINSCGHTFCAMCMLKWYFTKLHSSCGNWHTHVDCPICRAPIDVPERYTPRINSKFPLMFNRLLDTLLTETIGILTLLVDNHNNDEVQQASRTFKGKGKKTQVGSFNELPEEALAWREGGDALRDWRERTQQGRTEIEYIHTHWRDLQAGGFVALKEEYGV